ncbi:hypothetical protein G6F37_003154 [Rhizopus arrhizus]|nr:hypothetical protein G6F38_006165 [Rhizopus arrhizus]KAG1161364.1 hypothetical protein G6F37_003154 [Rhizopus arrhizus]
MCDLNWCPVCEKAISAESDSLYCSVDCLLKDGNDFKSNELTHTFRGFLYPKQHNVNIHICRDDDLADSIKIPESIPTLESMLSNEDDTDDEENNIFSCCDYCENKMNKGWNFSKSFKDVCPSYNPLWAENMPDMEQDQP